MISARNQRIRTNASYAYNIRMGTKHCSCGVKFDNWKQSYKLTLRYDNDYVTFIGRMLAKKLLIIAPER